MKKETEVQVSQLLTVIEQVSGAVDAHVEKQAAIYRSSRSKIEFAQSAKAGFQKVQ